jgi:hypothetical protein
MLGRTLTYTVKLKDKVMDEGVQALSANGKTGTDTSWVSGKETEKKSISMTNSSCGS